MCSSVCKCKYLELENKLMTKNKTFVIDHKISKNSELNCQKEVIEMKNWMQ